MLGSPHHINPHTIMMDRMKQDNPSMMKQQQISIHLGSLPFGMNDASKPSFERVQRKHHEDQHHIKRQLKVKRKLADRSSQSNVIANVIQECSNHQQVTRHKGDSEHMAPP
jgi:hypothetical protein